MRKYNDILFLSAIRKCSTAKYRTGVFFRNRIDIRPVFRYGMECIMGDKEESASFLSLRMDNEIRFKSGGSIKFLSMSNNTRGHAFHEVLYAEDIAEESLPHIQLTEKSYP